MAFGDKLKGFTEQAKERVAENREKIQEAVDAASVLANEKTRGKYADKISRVNQKTGSALDKFSADARDEADATAETAGRPQGVADVTPHPVDQPPLPDPTGSEGAASTQSTGGSPTSDEGLKFDE